MIDRSSSPVGSGERPIRRASSRRHFPEAWLALVAALALIAGVVTGVLAPDEANGLLRPVVVGSAAAGLLLGVVGGVLWADAVKLAWMGALAWSVVFSVVAHVAWYGGSLPEEESGGLGQVIGFVFVITFVPVFLGALLGHELQRSPRTTSAAVIGGAAFVTGLLWLLGKLLNLS